MTTKQVTDFAMSLPEVQRNETNDGKNIVFTKGDSVFLLIRKESGLLFVSVLLPEAKGLELQEEYNIVSPSSIRVKDWIDIDINNNFLIEEIKSWIRESYDIVSKASKDAESEKYVSLTKMLGL